MARLRAPVLRKVIGHVVGTLLARPGDPEFLRRERLREDRQRLVGTLQFRSGAEFRDINRWVNEKVADGRPVAEQTVSELEQGVRLLGTVIYRLPRIPDGM